MMVEESLALFRMKKSAYAYNVKEQAFVDFPLEERHRVMILDCWIEQENGVSVDPRMTIEKLLRENHGTSDHPLVLKFPAEPTHSSQGS